MKNIYETVKENPLWNGINSEDFEKMLKCAEATVKNYKKNDIIIFSGGEIKNIGMIMSGSVKIVKEDAAGNSAIISEISTTGIFGETLACAGIDRSPVTVIAAAECEIVFINYRKIINSCQSACRFHSTLIENMLKLLAEKNLMLSQKIEILSKRSLRDRLLAFFNIQKNAGKKIKIPYNREELAQYICADRSAVSNELCKMRDEGLIVFKKNEFEILF